MSTKIFVNLPVNHLQHSIDFFTAIGYTFNLKFSDETAACMVVSNDIYVMLLTHDKMKQFVKKQIADATQTTEVLICLSVESKEAVNILVDKALAAGATEDREAAENSFMFYRSFNDLDGHIWEIMWMDENAANQQ